MTATADAGRELLPAHAGRRPDEVRDLAEAMLKERSLSSYYGRGCAQGPAARRQRLRPRGCDAGAAGEHPRLGSLVVEDFEDHSDAEQGGEDKAVHPKDTPTLAERAHPKNEAVPGQAPPRDALPEAWRSETAVLCVAGRGPLDEASSAMLAQLLRKHGLGATVIGYEAVSRDRIRELDLTGVAMVCISYLDISGSPAHLRYLLERLKRRAPDMLVLVGLWPVGEKVLTDAALGRQIGADVYVASLRDGVEACLKAAR